jgi:glutamate formiminotransferase / 5-formyltetrahydrofolate cyclo-ligase
VLAECVVNISEGRDLAVVGQIAGSAGDALLDVHTDPDHHRSVLTLGGPLDRVEEAARSVAAVAVEQIDLRSHRGAHPRLGAVDVVPFVPFVPESPFDGPLGPTLGARDRFARWAGAELALPCFLYGPERSLPDVRRTAFRTLDPDTGPRLPHPTAGASAVGARPVLIAYNVWVAVRPEGGMAPGHTSVVELARHVAARVRGPGIRSLGLAVGDSAQVSCNLVDPGRFGVAAAYDAVARELDLAGGAVVRAELVGLLPRHALHDVPRHRWAELDLGEERTVEARLASPPGGGAPATTR